MTRGWFGGFLRAPQRPSWTLLGVALGLGVLAAAGQAPLGLWWLALPALAGLLHLVASAAHVRAAVWLGWLGGAGYFAASMHWIIEPFLVEPERHGWMVPFVLPLLGFGLALFWALAAGIGFWIGGGRAALRIAGTAIALAGAELARGYVLTGLPWAAPGHIWLDTPVAQAVSLIGASGLTLVTLLLAAAPVAAGLQLMRLVPALAAGAAVLAGIWVWGTARLSQAMPSDQDVIVRLVQPNAPQHLKWHPDWVWVFLDRHLDFTAAPSDRAPDLVIWSESAIPWLFEDAGPVLEDIALAAGGVPVILGGQRSEGGRYFNSLAVVDETGTPTQIYDKHHLVPFGEYVPLVEAILGPGYSGLAARQLSGFSSGPGPALLDLGALGQVLPLICYEAIFPRHFRGTDRPDWVLQLTNDAWFGQFSGPYQHLAQARLRAIEMGLPIVRAANTGVSAVIDPFGRITSELGLNRMGYLDASVPAAIEPTAFARWGEVPLALVLGLALAGLIGFRATRRRIELAG